MTAVLGFKGFSHVGDRVLCLYGDEGTRGYELFPTQHFDDKLMGIMREFLERTPLVSGVDLPKGLDVSFSESEVIIKKGREEERIVCGFMGFGSSKKLGKGGVKKLSVVWDLTIRGNRVTASLCGPIRGHKRAEGLRARDMILVALREAGDQSFEAAEIQLGDLPEPIRPYITPAIAQKWLNFYEPTVQRSGDRRSRFGLQSSVMSAYEEFAQIMREEVSR